MKRLKQLRLARGYTLDALAKEIGGLVTKQALSKYETGRSRPSATVANQLAAVLGIKAINLWFEPSVSVEIIAYRKLARLAKKEQARIEAVVSTALQERCWVQDKLCLKMNMDWMGFPITHLNEAEKAAYEVRRRWSLGLDSISDLTGILEDNLVHVLEVDTQREFDGIAALAKDAEGEIIASGVTTRTAIAGDRYRMNLAHELGHLVLKTDSACDEEAAAFRFAGAFLVPEETLKREIGSWRNNIQLPELLALKRRFGISIQALLRRMLDLSIISESAYTSWQIAISKQGWRTQEPEPLKPEKPDWLRRMLLRALAEGIVSAQEAEDILGTLPTELMHAAPMKRAAFLRLPIEQRRKILETQAEDMRRHYEESLEKYDLETGEVESYEPA